MTKIKSYRDEILKYVNKKYGTAPEFLWARYPNYAVLRRADNKKWYGIILDVPRKRLGLDGDDIIDILNVKCDAGLYAFINGEKAFYMAIIWAERGFLFY